MRILHVSGPFPPLGGVSGELVAELLRAQTAAGHRVEVVTPTPGEPMPHVRRLERRPCCGSVQALCDLIRPDVVHVHAGTVSPFAWRAVRRARRARIPALLTIHSLWGAPGVVLYRALLAGWSRSGLPLDPRSGWGAGLAVTVPSDVAAGPVRTAVAGRVPVWVVPHLPGVGFEQYYQAVMR